jgi:hypothetical protein
VGSGYGVSRRDRGKGGCRVGGVKEDRMIRAG